MKILITLLSILAATIQPMFAQVTIQANGSLNYAIVLCNGPSSTKYDLVFIGDGFTSAEQTMFNQKVDEAVQAMRDLTPYRETMCSFNIWRVNVVSTQSGVDHPKDGIFKNTALDCRYGNPAIGQAERCIQSDSPAKCYEAAGYAPAYDAVFVLVNDTQWGGCAGGLVFSSISTNFSQIITHELGHKVGGLADEYDCYVCDGTDAGRIYTGPEPSQVNLTKNTNRATTKWGDLILPATPIPTTSGASTVGLWAGGGYYGTGIYRPQQTCQMKSSSQPFCAVCHRTMRDVMDDRCTICELRPWFCFDRFIAVPWYDRIRWRIPWPWPPCLSCPPDRPDFSDVIFEVRFDEKFLEGSQLAVKDENGEILAKADVQKNGEPLVLTFKGNRFKSYNVEFESGKPQSAKITLKPTITARAQ